MDFKCGSDGVGMNVIESQVQLVQSGAVIYGGGCLVQQVVYRLGNGVCLGMGKNGGRNCVMFRFRL